MNSASKKTYMNRVIILVTLIILKAGTLPHCFAQQAQKLFDNREYALAIGEYEKLLKKKKITKEETANAEAHIGMCYYYLNQAKEASACIKKGITHGYKTAEIYCISGLASQKQERYTEALEAFGECLKLDSNYPGINLYTKSCKYAIEHSDPKTSIKLRSSKINTEGSEYGLSPCANNEIFFSLASNKGKIDPRTGMGYTEIYTTKLEGSELSKPKKETAFMKAYYNTGVFTYDSVSNHIYMTMCEPKSGKCGIYKSRYNRKKWEKPEPFFINANYDMAHPALAKNGSRLYFVSNAPGGYGKTDIWYADRINDTQWSEPINAGSKINTAEREEFPFVEGDSILFFSSNGHVGFGGLDIFAAALVDNEILEPMNMGRPFNSGADDFNMVSYGHKGLMVSSRNIKNSDDIYIFNRMDLPSPTRPEKAKPEPEPEPIVIAQPEPVVSIPLPEPPVAKPQGNNIATVYFDFNKFVPQREFRTMYDEIVAQMKSYPNAIFEIAGYTDPRGGKEFNSELSDKRAEYIAKRLIIRGVNKANIVVKGYGFNNPAAPDATTEAEFQKNRRVEIRIIKTNQ